MGFIQFLSKEKYIIAEFFYSYYKDILIKEDALKLVSVLKDASIIKDSNKATKLRMDIRNNEDGCSAYLLKLLFRSISGKQLNEIMDEYYGRNGI